MSDYTAKRIDDMDALYGGGFRKARAELGVTAFGFQVIELPPGFDGYPEHDHAEEGQEEVYVALRGAATIDIEGEQVPLDPDTMVRVGATTRRKVLAGEQGIRMLIIGGTPGQAYTVKAGTEIGAPAPPLGQPVAK